MKCLLDGISTSISFLPTSPRKLQEQYILILLQPCMLLELQSAAISFAICAEGQEQLNVVFVVNRLLKVGLPVMMVDKMKQSFYVSSG